MEKRVFLIVLDSVGVGSLPDWREFDDSESNTLGNIARAVGGLNLPHMSGLGLGNIIPIQGVPPVAEPSGAWGRAMLSTHGKDTTAGHWEMMGIVLEQGFPTYPQGFPDELITALEDAFGIGILGTKPASGTAIIAELGEEHLRTKKPIVYTSADSVLQIACHEDVYCNEELYELCRKARKICHGRHGVGRIIARPFRGNAGHFERTAYRRDFSLLPPMPNLLDEMQKAGVLTTGVGKISDIFAAQFLDMSYPLKGNSLCLSKTQELMAERENEGFFFINLVDFDMLYGHRNDPVGYGKALEEFDKALPQLMKHLKQEDLMIITADHGNDPTTPSTDHNREYVPVLCYGPALQGKAIGDRASLADIGATAFRWLTGQQPILGHHWL